MIATSAPRVHRVIIIDFCMWRNEEVVTKTFDRDNLIIGVYFKLLSVSYRTTLDPLVNKLVSSLQSREDHYHLHSHQIPFE